jgi:hypothetical protein
VWLPPLPCTRRLADLLHFFLLQGNCFCVCLGGVYKAHHKLIDLQEQDQQLTSSLGLVGYLKQRIYLSLVRIRCHHGLDRKPRNGCGLEYMASALALLRCGVRVHELEDMHGVVIVWPDRAAA